MAKIMDPILPILSILRYWAIPLGSVGGPGILDIATSGIWDQNNARRGHGHAQHHVGSWPELSLPNPFEAVRVPLKRLRVVMIFAESRQGEL